LPNGKAYLGPATGNVRATKEPGARSIERRSRDSFRVRVILSAEEHDRRWVAFKERSRQRDERLDSMPRPEPLAQPTKDSNEVDREWIDLIVELGSVFADAHHASAARFAVGDSALYFQDTGDEYGEVVEVVGEFRRYNVSNDGHRLGYCVRRDGGERFFVPAGKLMTEGCKVRHLCLVAP
jgi:hypothetical protein